MIDTETADGIVARLHSAAARRDPYPVYAELHRLGTAARLTPERSVYGVVVQGFEAVDGVLRDPRYLKILGPKDKLDHPVLAKLSKSMMFSLEPDHSRMRRLFQKVFTPRRIAGLEPTLINIVDELLDRLADAASESGSADFIAEFGYPFPTSVIGVLLDLPQEDLGWFRRQAEHIDEYLDMSGKTPEKLAAADQAALDLTEYYLGLIADRRARPGTDLVSDLVRVIDSDDDKLTDEELVCNLIVLMNASFVTTMNLLGNGLPPMLEQPELVEQVRADPDVASRAVEEVLRWDSPVQLLTRQASADGEIDGVPVRDGDLVLTLLGAANRDPRRFTDPDAFRPDRPGVQHVSFGGGAYFCIGAALSRLEGRVAFPRIFQRFPALALAGPPVQGDHLLLRGYAELPVTPG